LESKSGTESLVGLWVIDPDALGWICEIVATPDYGVCLVRRHYNHRGQLKESFLDLVRVQDMIGWNFFSKKSECLEMQ
jgi:hypothetical protein